MPSSKKSGLVTKTVVGHVVVLLLFGVFTEFKGCKPKVKERIQMVNIAPSAPSINAVEPSPAPPDPSPPDPTPPTPQPVPPDPTPPPPKPQPPKPPEPPPEPAWKPVTAKDIKISNEKVKVPQKKPEPREPQPTPRPPEKVDFRDRLKQNLPDVPRLSTAGPTAHQASAFVDELGMIQGLIREKLYRAWEVPVGMDPQLEAEILVVLSKSGNITHTRLAKSSGVHAYDQSALAAAKDLRFVKPLPAGYGKASEEFIIVFNQTR